MMVHFLVGRILSDILHLPITICFRKMAIERNFLQNVSLQETQIAESLHLWSTSEIAVLVEG